MSTVQSYEHVYDSQCEIVQQLLRFRLQLQVVEAHLRKEDPNHADMIADLAEDADRIIEIVDEGREE